MTPDARERFTSHEYCQHHKGICVPELLAASRIVAQVREKLPTLARAGYLWQNDDETFSSARLLREDDLLSLLASLPARPTEVKP